VGAAGDGRPQQAGVGPHQRREAAAQDGQEEAQAGHAGGQGGRQHEVEQRAAGAARRARAGPRPGGQGQRGQADGQERHQRGLPGREREAGHEPCADDQQGEVEDAGQEQLEDVLHAVDDPLALQALHKR
jgi:hypothetical protein